MAFRQLMKTALRGALQGPAAARRPAALASLSRAAAPATLRPATALWVRSFGAQTFLDEKEVVDRVLSVVKNFEKVEPAKVSAKARFKEDLSLDSLDVVEVVMAIEEEFALEIPDNEADKILSIDDAVKYITAHPQAK